MKTLITLIACWLAALEPAVGRAAAADAPFTGTWSGSFEIHFADGRIDTTAPPDPLYQKMLALDTAMFDSFNRCADPAQLAKHAAFFAKDVEFYHDLGGVEWGADAVIDSTRKNVCGKFRRELDAASFRVYPIPRFGAMTTGTHRFCHTPTTCEGIGEFTMVWKQTGDVWQVTRALSFAHRSLENPPAAQ